jgi:hypothetical protein
MIDLNIKRFEVMRWTSIIVLSCDACHKILAEELLIFMLTAEYYHEANCLRLFFCNARVKFKLETNLFFIAPDQLLLTLSFILLIILLL